MANLLATLGERAQSKRQWRWRGASLGLLWLGLALIIALAGYHLFEGLTARNYQFFLSRRIPNLLAMVLAAIAIGASALVFQTITHNRILTPSILGFDALYALLQVSLVVCLGKMHPWVLNPYLNFVWVTLAMVVSALLLFRLYFRVMAGQIYPLLLIGIVCSALFSSMADFMTLLVDPSEFTGIQDRLLASFNRINTHLVFALILPMAACLLWLWYLSPQLDVMWLGSENATSLGINTAKLTHQVLICITLMIAMATALVGPILFFGLIVVSVTRQLCQAFQHRILLIASSGVAVLMLLFAHLLVVQLFSFSTTLSVVINLIGGSYFLWLLTRQSMAQS
ncbi:Petrobactin import system permease protein YclO [Vibrio stylophorae]|uniref:Petrobactin import system permease protein YclO n=1 Tax=Vibrio stylophorae TaxID=659351 RepID=A0ABN8DRJ0_9VIBR|nr:iron chelate uptake ABC transporter family permease subunit [Vibrio stylophorae]CAH0533267.1 Petrobactin import system permease protein YclO [Vibrio stylophorae]